MTANNTSLWFAESLRITVFPTPAPYRVEKSWWEDLTGEPPEKSVRRPREDSITEEGNAFGGRVILAIQPGRIDWSILTPDPTEGFREFQDVTEKFLPPIAAWLRNASPPAQRLAFATVLRLPIEDRIQGYQKIFSFLPDIRIDPASGVRDFLFQINRPRVSTMVEGLQLNRLTKWSVAFQQVATFTYQGRRGQMASVQDTTFHCRLESDMNTDGEFSEEFNGEQLESLIWELKDLSFEIVERGDIP